MKPSEAFDDFCETTDHCNYLMIKAGETCEDCWRNWMDANCILKPEITNKGGK